MHELGCKYKHDCTEFGNSLMKIRTILWINLIMHSSNDNLKTISDEMTPTHLSPILPGLHLAVFNE